jgi:hypothetical protein
MPMPRAGLQPCHPLGRLPPPPPFTPFPPLHPCPCPHAVPPCSVCSVSLCSYGGPGAGVCVKAYVKGRMTPRHRLNLRREMEILSDLRAQG